MSFYCFIFHMKRLRIENWDWELKSTVKELYRIYIIWDNCKIWTTSNNLIGILIIVVDPMKSCLTSNMSFLTNHITNTSFTVTHHWRLLQHFWTYEFWWACRCHKKIIIMYADCRAVQVSWWNVYIKWIQKQRFQLQRLILGPHY